MDKTTTKPLMLSVLDGTPEVTPPIWLMRQAGRYLPEYQAARKKAVSFWTLCMTPSMAVEVTLQPIDRFDFDAAILFSDILVVPFALGQAVRFEDGVGPILDAFPGVERLVTDRSVWQSRLAPVYEALAATRAKLSPDKAMIGFAGAPWTLAAYMIETHGSPDQKAAKLLAYREPEIFARLLDQLAEAVAFHLINQIEAGADVVQIFDSWAGGLTDEGFENFVIAPTKKIVSLVRAKHPKARIIGFPRATTLAGYEGYAAETGVDAISLDTSAPMGWAAKTFGRKIALQGNLDPLALIAGGDALDHAVDRIMGAVQGTRFIFNLGHGVLPETPLAHVAQAIARVRGDAKRT